MLFRNQSIFQSGPLAASFLLFGLIVFCSFDSISFGQNLPGVPPRATNKPAQARQARPVQQEKVTIPEPEEVRLQTKDGFILVGTWYAPPTQEDKKASNTGKETVPYIVLHDWESSRRQTFQFAKFVQARGNGVLIPDLRGHGKSTQVEGSDKPQTFDKLAKSQRVMLMEDIESCKRFIVQRNNSGEVNVDLLTLVAVGRMAPVATRWALNDWTMFPARSPSGIKQAQDVKGLVLVSPRKKFGQFSMAQTIRHPLFTGKSGREMPMLLVWGSEDKNCNKDAKSIFSTLEKGRPDISQLETKEEQMAAKTLYSAKIEGSSLDANGLIANKNSVRNLWSYIESTMTQKAKKDIDQRKWQDRSRKNK